MLQARAELSDNKVNGPEDAVVSEMIKILPLEKICTVAMFSKTAFLGQMDAPSSWKIVMLFSCENQTQNQRRESGVAEQLRSSCRSGTRLV